MSTMLLRSGTHSRARNRRNCQRKRCLHLESLEDRNLLSATIRGTVFDDANRNASFDAGESGQSRWTVELQTASQVDGSPSQILTADAPGDLFGVSIASSANRILVGAPYASGQAGLAYLFDSAGNLRY